MKTSHEYGVILFYIRPDVELNLCVNIIRSDSDNKAIETTKSLYSYREELVGCDFAGSVCVNQSSNNKIIKLDDGFMIDWDSISGFLEDLKKDGVYTEEMKVNRILTPILVS